MTLLRNFHNNVPIHRIRAAKTEDAIAHRWDKLLHTTLCTILNTTEAEIIQHEIHLPTDHGGLGIHDLNLRRHVAHYSAWRQSAFHTNEQLGAETEKAWKENNPTTSQHLIATAAAIQPFTKTPLEVDWTEWVATPPDKHLQKRVLLDAYSTFHTQLLNKLTPEQQAITRSAGGKGAAA